LFKEDKPKVDPEDGHQDARPAASSSEDDGDFLIEWAGKKKKKAK
jgi:hypothetical protein